MKVKPVISVVHTVTITLLI